MLDTAIKAAEEAGKLLRRTFATELVVNEALPHDIKLEVDVQAQELISRIILAEYPGHGIFGEEGLSGNPDADVRWVVDPLDGTVNYYYGIPHYAVSIGVQRRTGPGQWQTVVGVVYAPEVDELYTATAEGPATMNGRPIQVSNRAQISEAIVVMGFFKNEETIRRSLRDFENLVFRVRKMRLSGSAALDCVYVACGRFDGYLEHGIKLWDICAGELILDRAGGRTEKGPGVGPDSYAVRMWNGKFDWGLPAPGA